MCSKNAVLDHYLSLLTTGLPLYNFQSLDLKFRKTFCMELWIYSLIYLTLSPSFSSLTKSLENLLCHSYIEIWSILLNG